MIVAKFGGTSVGEAARILGVTAIVGQARARRPVVVVSALAGVTDLLVAAADAARRGEREGLEPILSDLERRHRWAVAGTVEAAGPRHDLGLRVDGLLDELRQLLRSLRILGEQTPRSTDAVLAFGELLSGPIVAAALRGRGIPAAWVDPREVVVTDGRHGQAEPDLEATAARAAAVLVPRVEAGEVPVTGGFVGATPDGRTTTLGRGGSDLSASVLGAAMGAEEIEIWTDVDGLMTADPRLCPAARTLPRIGFAEAAELAWFGAKVLHPACLAPAVRRGIPVRVRNTLRPAGEGTVVAEDAGPGAPPVCSVASRDGRAAVRVASRRRRLDPGFLPRVLSMLDRAGLAPDLVVSSEASLTAVVADAPGLDAAVADLRGDHEVEAARGRAVLVVVGPGLAGDPRVRGEVLGALAALGPDAAALGGSARGAAALLPGERLGEAVRAIHRRFFEEGGS